MTADPRVTCAGTGTGLPRVRKWLPAKIPVPVPQSMGFHGYGYGYSQKYPRVTRDVHYSPIDPEKLHSVSDDWRCSKIQNIRMGVSGREYCVLKGHRRKRSEGGEGGEEDRGQ